MKLKEGAIFVHKKPYSVPHTRQDGVFVVHTVVLDGTLVIKYNVVLLVAVRYFIVVVIAVIISIAVLSVPITVSVHHDVVIKQLYYLLTVLTR